MKADLQTKAMRVSLWVAVLMLVGKLTAYFITGSVAILSDAAESVIHIVATGVATFSLWYSRQPASKRYPYGHGKVAFFSAGFEGALILSAAVFIVYEGIWELIAGPHLKELGAGILITGGLALVNLALGVYLIVVGRRQNALILVANGKHVLTDMWTSAAVVVGVTVVWITIQLHRPLLWLDPVVAIGAGLNIMYTAGALIARSFSGLMDEADPSRTKLILEALDQASANGAISGYHHLRHRHSNDIMWVEVHMLVPGSTTTATAHRRVTRIEETIRGLFPEFQVYITTHVEPDLHEKAHPHGHPGMDDAIAAAQNLAEEGRGTAEP